MPTPSSTGLWRSHFCFAAGLCMASALLAAEIATGRVSGLVKMTGLIGYGASVGKNSGRTSHVVRTQQELDAAISDAAAGDTIRIAPGIYDRLDIRNRQFAAPLVLTSADTGDFATIETMAIAGSSGVILRRLHLRGRTEAGVMSIGIFKSKNVRLEQIVGEGPAGPAGYQLAPFVVRDSSNVSIVNSEFRHLQHGIALLGTRGSTLIGNYFHDLRTDGIRGGANSDMTIRFNFFTDFHPEEHDHPDGVQMWTTGTTESSRQIVISDNVIVRQAGGAPIQGIFLGEEKKSVPYVSVEIARNLVIGGMFNGIAIAHAESSSVIDNEVVSLPGQRSWIGAILSPDLIISGNRALLYLIDRKKVKPKGNSENDTAKDGGAASLKRWFAARKVNYDGTLTSIPANLRQLAMADDR